MIETLITRPWNHPDVLWSGALVGVVFLIVGIVALVLIAERTK